MAAIDYADIDAPEPLAADVIERVQQGRPFVPNLYRMLLHSPGVASGWVHLSNEVRFASTVDDRSRELAILLVSHLTNCAYEWHHHTLIAGRVGIAPDEIERLKLWPNASGWSAADRALLSYVDAVERRTPLGQGVVEALEERFGARTLVELTATITYYGAVARFLLALDIEIDP